VCFLKDPNAAPRERYVDMLHLDASLVFVPDSGVVGGGVTHTFNILRTQLDSLFLDAIDMRVFKVLLDGQAIDFRSTQVGITAYFNPSIRDTFQHKLSITYEAAPRRGMYFIGWDDPSSRSRKQIWTQGQGIDNRHWIPLFDDLSDKITTDIQLRFHKDYSVLSNGSLLAKSNVENDIVWHYRMSKPHAPYLIMVGIGKYLIDERLTAGGVPLRLYYYPEFKNRVETTYRYSTEIFDFLQSQIDFPYPWGSYSQIPVQDYLYGAMENTSATVFGDFFQVDSIGFNDRNYVYVNGHELAHQWFGDLVTARSGAHHWLQESFATYWHQRVIQKFEGDAAYRYELYKDAAAAISASKRNMRAVAHSSAGSERHYLKGSYVLHMLHYVTGDEIFRKALSLYLHRHAFANASTDDLLDAFYDVSGVPLNTFWNQWVKKGGEPSYVLNCDTVKFGKDRKLRVILQQTLDSGITDYFEMPLWLHAYYEDGKADSVRVFNTTASDTALFDLPKRNQLQYILFDKGNNVLKKEKLQISRPFILQQAEKAHFDIDRLRALDALGREAMPDEIDALLRNMEGDCHYALQASAFKRLISLDSQSAYNAAFSILHPKFWQSVLPTLGLISEKYRPQFEKVLALPSYELKAMALEYLCFSFPEKAPEYLEQTKQLTGNSGSNLRIKWLYISYRLSGDKNFAEELADMCTNSFDFLTRIGAAHALKAINYCSPTAVEGFIQGIYKRNWRLAGEMAKALRHFYNDVRYTSMIEQQISSIHISVDQKERLNSILKK
jgi:aminopeptidase N